MRRIAIVLAIALLVVLWAATYELLGWRGVMSCAVITGGLVAFVVMGQDSER